MASAREPLQHDLKATPADYGAVVSGDKTFVVRRNDRDFRVGDTLRLHEWIPDAPEVCRWDAKGLTGTCTGSYINMEVTYLQIGQYGLPEDVAVMAIRPSPMAPRLATA